MKKSVVWAISIFVWIGWLCPLHADQVPKNGTVKEFDVQGGLRAILKYKDGQLIGKKVYHKNGKLLVDAVYQNGRPTVLKSYYVTGVLKSQWTLKSGETKYYSPTGKHEITVEDRHSKDSHK